MTARLQGTELASWRDQFCGVIHSDREAFGPESPAGDQLTHERTDSLGDSVLLLCSSGYCQLSPDSLLLLTFWKLQMTFCCCLSAHEVASAPLTAGVDPAAPWAPFWAPAHLPMPLTEPLEVSQNMPYNARSLYGGSCGFSACRILPCTSLFYPTSSTRPAQSG